MDNTSHESWIIFSYDLTHPLRLTRPVIVGVLCNLKPWIKFILIYLCFHHAQVNNSNIVDQIELRKKIVMVIPTMACD